MTDEELMEMQMKKFDALFAKPFNWLALMFWIFFFAFWGTVAYIATHFIRKFW